MARFFDREPAVIPISDLYFDDTGPHILQRGAETAQALPLSRLELVSHGEHLRLAADAIERAPSPTQRELRVHTLAGTFRALAVAGEGPLPQTLGRFVEAAREAVSLGHAVRVPAAFAQALRTASVVLTAATAGDDAGMAAGLQQAVVQLGALSRVPEPPAPPIALEIAEAPGSTFATFLKEVADAVEAPAAVPIESLAPAPEPEPAPPPAPEPPPLPPPPAPEAVAAPIAQAPATPAAAPAPPPLRVRFGARRPAMPPITLTERSETPAETPDIVGSWITYQRMVVSGVGPPSLDVLMGHVPEVVSGVAGGDGVEELPIVDIKTLQYGGAAALARVQELRTIARSTPSVDLPALFEEVCDLVDLAFEPGA